MRNLRFNAKFIIWSGFGVVIALMLLLSAVMIYKLNQQTDEFENVIKVNNTKVSLAHIMRDSIRLRSLSLNKMALSDDMFVKNDEKLKFDIYANRFIRAFDKFRIFELNKAELELTSLVQKKTDLGYPISQKASLMILADISIDKTKPIILDAIAAQEQNLIVLDELIALQKSYAVESFKTAEVNMSNMLTLLLVVVSIACLFSVVVSQAVSKIVSRNNIELAKATETKSIFLANMSHEIRTPLTAIIGFAKSQMVPNLPDAHNKRSTKIILRNSEHLLTVINDILDFSKIEANRLDIELTEFSLFKLLDDVYFSLIGLIKEKPLKLNINYNYPLPNLIRSDKVRLRQVLMNLGGNAIKFTDEGFVNLNVRYDRIKNDVYFDINDTGIGMTGEQQEKVFNTFNQADISITRKYGGTGLGLTISHELVTKLGGNLSVMSKIDIGSTFSFKIENRILDEKKAVKLINQLASDTETQDELLSEHSLRNLHSVKGSILLVEDSLDNQELISFYLEELGATVTVVNNGKKAVDLTKSSDFDLVLMDMQMPVMGGIEAVRLIRERGDDCPIVMLTANAAKEFKEQSLSIGCNDFLIKPLDEEQLNIVVEKYLSVIEQDEFLSQEVAVKPVLNEKSDIIVSSLVKKNASKYDKFISKFINYLPTYVDEISKYIKQRNDNELKVVAHKLKGVGGNMGFEIITEISANFEIAIRQGNRDEIARLFKELKTAANKIYRGNESQKNSHVG